MRFFRTFGITNDMSQGMTDREFIMQHREEDVRSVALARVPEGVDALWCMQQIEGWQKARTKLPLWAECKDLWFPPRLSMEQCSSELTALYKRDVLLRLLPGGEERREMVDLTAGYGVDFSYMGMAFCVAHYVERQEQLCRIAAHNMPLLGLNHAVIHNTEAESWCKGMGEVNVVFMDPARRDDAGRKTVAIEDCTPDVGSCHEALLSRCDYLMVKLSPMLDITQALRTIRHVCEVHVVSVKGECKELLLIASMKHARERVTYTCVNLSADDAAYSWTEGEKRKPVIAEELEGYIHEPNASILKAGIQDCLCLTHGVRKLHTKSNLFVSREPVRDFPGRSMRITGWSDFSKKGLKALVGDLTQANITTRNFPTSVAELRKRLKLKEGGDVYLFATTTADGSHVLIRGEYMD